MQASTAGYVTTLLGRRRSIPDINSPIQARRQFGQRAALNSVIQGSAADLIKLAMVHLHQKLEPRATDIRMLMQIHDELVFECKAEFATEMSSLIKSEMESAIKLTVPLRVDIATGLNWLENE
jgi:DNA polymerase-1